jgi:dipeptidyl-peptidase-4
VKSTIRIAIAVVDVTILGFLMISGFVRLASSQTNAAKPLTIEAIFAEGGITGRPPESLEWSPDNLKLAYILRDDAGQRAELWYVDAATGQRKLLVNENKLSTLAPPLSSIKNERQKEWITRYNVAPYQWAPDSRTLLFSAQGQLWLYSLEKGIGVQLTSMADPSEDPKFSPDGKRIAYVRKRNLFVRDIGENSEKQLTNDKSEDILNGQADWVYAEELNVRSNYFWSPNGKQIAFLQMNESQVPVYPLANWLPTRATVDLQKYPKPGDPNPEVRLGVVESKGGRIRWISMTTESTPYIPRFGWVRDGILWVEVLNRTQDTMDLYFLDANSGKSRLVLSEHCEGCWVKVNDDFRVLKSGDRFLWTSWRSGNAHLYLYSFNKDNPLAAEAKLEKQLTNGDFEVLNVEGVDEDATTIFISCNKDDPRERQLYSVKFDGTEPTRISSEDGTHTVNFAADGKHYLDAFSALMTPPQRLMCSANGNCKKFWESRSVADYGLLPPKLLEFKAEDGTKLYGELLLPAAGSGNTKIPLIINVYGGPAAQLVTNSWIELWDSASGLFHQIMAQKGFAVFTLDNRGTPNRDRKFETAIRHQFGAVELQDQLTALDQLFAEVPQLDRSRVGIWGWSNGGSMTLYALTHSDVFKTGVSIAPVTDWRNYDSIYTERYMGLPKDNAKPYDDTLPKAAANLNATLLLVHGTSDDNVHFQNSVQMVDALIKAGKQFHFMLYPDKTHSISGSAASIHLFHMIEDHFEQQLKQP